MSGRTLQDLANIAALTPLGEPVGLTALEMRTIEDACGGRRFGPGVVFMGRRVVRIPWDWERSLHSQALPG